MSVMNNAQDFARLEMERHLWLAKLQGKDRYWPQDRRQHVIHNSCVAASRASLDDPFAGPRARAHLLVGAATPEDFGIQQR